MTRAKTWLAAAALFVAGMVAGAALAAVVVAIHHGPELAFAHGRPDVAVRIITRRLSFALGLDSEQREALRKVAEETLPRLAAAHDECVPKVDAAIQDARNELAPHLRPDQLAHLDAILAEARARRQRARNRIGDDG